MNSHSNSGRIVASAYELIVFDLDGTLVDSLDDLTASVATRSSRSIWPRSTASASA